MSLRLPRPLSSNGWNTRQWQTWLDAQGVLAGLTPQDGPRCGLCRQPSRPDNFGVHYERCFVCARSYGDVLQAVVPISYSVSGGLTSLIAQAKDEPERVWVRYGLASVLYEFLARHRPCLERAAGGRLTVATVVPSHPSRREGRDHLKELLGCVNASAWPGADTWDLGLLSKAGSSVAGDRRGSLDANLFLAQQDGRVAGQRVLLVDDLFTTGSTTASAAAALRAAGARSVVAVTLGRQLSDNPIARAFVRDNGIAGRGLQPANCAVHTL